MSSESFEGVMLECHSCHSQIPLEAIEKHLEPESPENGDLYYLQNGFVGNDMCFWRKNGAGYTTNLDEAHVFTRKQAFAQHSVRSDDVPRKKQLIDSLGHRALDMQTFALRGAHL